MTTPPVCAVIVTYHPTPSMLEGFQNLIPQVQGMVVVDNGSNVDALRALRTASADCGFHLLENGENLGIAEALNRGVRWAKAQGYPWVILFDQDSILTPAFVHQMFQARECHPHRERVGAVHPRYVNPDSGLALKVPRAQDGGPIFLMTSGSLMPMWIFDRLGLFASEYFIDFVDWEFCFRTRLAGYLVIESPEAVLLHDPGDPAPVTILGHTFHPSHHNSMRRYYISRNAIVFYRKYFFAFPGWVLRGIYGFLKETIVCLVAEQSRARKFRNILLGLFDGLIGRMGKREGI